MPRALLSVTDKSGLIEFAHALSSRGFELVSTGGTAKTIRESGLAVTDVSAVTGFPEILDGRVKTLHPHVHAGLLADLRTPAHVETLNEQGIAPFDIVAVNLYRFEETVRGGATWDAMVESIDIGGPAMVRASAKNHANVLIVTEPSDYDRVISLWDSGATEASRRELAAKAFAHTALYDSMIARHMASELGLDPISNRVTIGLRLRQSLRYGENSHQYAGLYEDPLAQGGLAQARIVGGKEVSYNNLLDAEAAWGLVCDLPDHSVAIIKHGNPCGAASMGNASESYRAARAADPISAFGGIAALNGILDRSAAETMAEKGNFLEVVLAREITKEAEEVFAHRAGWGPDCRLIEVSKSTSPALTLRAISGGYLVQTADEIGNASDWRAATDRQPTETEWSALRMAWRIVPHVKSNAIVIADSHRLLGVGAGQMNRVQSVRLALEQAGDQSQGAALASDAFFPFPDSIETAAKAGIKAIIQPGGSKKDSDVIAAANAHGIAMVLTGRRHFRH
ncbi:MAG: bifunctional phosphoribosylaminoimidazolecarboxamide formyltransferase/IMP cyclohydrolase [Fimbriimonadaceae bacterium]|nr:bifunctional phosphoribosylaminoimidazolecarboxamide formyltransferase/IMP cyclohydrolase [Fimbriimonadaceae bacterium]